LHSNLAVRLSSAGGRAEMRMWLLSFKDTGAAIIEAETMAHARLLVAVKGLVRASHFVEGCQIDPEYIPLIPGEAVGRRLSADEAHDLLMLLKRGLTGHGTEQIPAEYEVVAAAE
jgi:hypothetical protein